MATIDALNTVSRYLARRDIPELSAAQLREPVDVLILLGSSLTEPLQVAAHAMKQGLARRMLISGGIGHSTRDLYDTVASHPAYHTVQTENRAEADILFDIATKHMGMNPELIMVENRSTTCGFNAEESRKVLDSRAITARSLLLIQDPTMQRRSQACFERNWSDRPDTSILSFAPFIPRVAKESGDYVITDSAESVWPFERFVSLLLGEIARLRDDKNGYGPSGRNFIDRIDIPGEVLSAHEDLLRQFSELARD